MLFIIRDHDLSSRVMQSARSELTQFLMVSVRKMGTSPSVVESMRSMMSDSWENVTSDLRQLHIGHRRSRQNSAACNFRVTSPVT